MKKLFAFLFLAVFVPCAFGAKITELPEETAPAGSDITAIVDDPSGTPVTKKTTIANLSKGINASNIATGTLAVAQGGTGAGSASAARTALGLAIGTDVQAYDADLTTYAGITPSANIQTLLGSADYAAARTSLGLVIGTNVQAYDADLTTYAGITPSANVQSLLGAANYAAMRAQLDLEAGTDFYSISGADAAFQPLEATLTDIADGTILEDLVNTANPWADNEVADTITASNYLPLAGGTLTGELKIDETGIEGQPTDTLTDCSTFSATGGGMFYDDSEGKWKKCQDNVLTDLDTGGSITGSDTRVLFFDGANSPAGDGGFTYNKTTDSATLAGDLTVLTETYDATNWNGDNTVPTKDAVRDKIETLSAGSGSTAINLPIYSAKLTGAFTVFTPPSADACTQGAQIDAGDGNWRLLFDATTDECATWQFVIPSNYTSTPLLNVYYTMTSATSLDVEFEAAIMCVSDNDGADSGTASFSNVAVATETVDGTVGDMQKITITLTDDSCAAGDVAFIVLSTDANDATNDDATGDREVVGVSFDYT